MHSLWCLLIGACQLCHSYCWLYRWFLIWFARTVCCPCMRSWCRYCHACAELALSTTSVLWLSAGCCCLPTACSTYHYIVIIATPLTVCHSQAAPSQYHIYIPTYALPTLCKFYSHYICQTHSVSSKFSYPYSSRHCFHLHTSKYMRFCTRFTRVPNLSPLPPHHLSQWVCHHIITR